VIEKRHMQLERSKGALEPGQVTFDVVADYQASLARQGIPHESTTAAYYLEATVTVPRFMTDPATTTASTSGIPVTTTFPKVTAPIRLAVRQRARLSLPLPEQRLGPSPRRNRRAAQTRSLYSSDSREPVTASRFSSLRDRTPPCG